MLINYIFRRICNGYTRRINWGFAYYYRMENIKYGIEEVNNKRSVIFTGRLYFYKNYTPYYETIIERGVIDMPCGVDIIGIEKICAVFRCCENINETARKTGYSAGQVYYVVSTYYDPDD